MLFFLFCLFLSVALQRWRRSRRWSSPGGFKTLFVWVCTSDWIGKRTGPFARRLLSQWRHPLQKWLWSGAGRRSLSPAGYNVPREPLWVCHRCPPLPQPLLLLFVLLFWVGGISAARTTEQAATKYLPLIIARLRHADPSARPPLRETQEEIKKHPNTLLSKVSTMVKGVGE